jgi:hypothetical protein
MKSIHNNMRAMLMLLAVLVLPTREQEFLENVPITFALGGTVQYIPSTGGVAIQGYQITVGFDRFSWLGRSSLT